MIKGIVVGNDWVNMKIHQSVQEFQTAAQELAEAKRRKLFRDILKLILIGFFISRDVESEIQELAHRKDKVARRIEEQISEELGTARTLVEQIQSSGTYLVHTKKENCISRLELLEADLTLLDKKGILEQEVVESMRREVKRYSEQIFNYNIDFIEQRRREYGYLWSKGLLSLDDEQQTAIVTDDKHNLVVAAAGSGKTEVLITRIAYLIAREPDGIKPSRILAIAYQNKDVKQIEDRLDQQYGIAGVNVSTFHRLGIDVLRIAGKMKSILGKNERPHLIKGIYQGTVKSRPDVYQAFLKYVKSLHDTAKEEDIAAKASTLEMRRTLPYTSINDVRVQSRAEKEILDFLLTSKLNRTPIHVEYEPEIEGLGKPDFHLPGYDLFIEHWGLNRDGEVPEFFDQSTTEYKENMERKKKWLADNNKLLVETFSYEYDEDHPEVFLQLLKDRISERLQTRHDRDFRFSTMAYRELIELVCESDRDWITEDRVSKDIFNFIRNAKTYDLKPERILQKLESGKWSRKQRTFGKLAVMVYETYQDRLMELRKIDFEDMINIAVDELRADRELCKDMYDHILVDEYQDISEQRFKLIRELLAQNPKCKLFCVGDDWQSIMGFAGSNLEFLVHFEKYFDNPAITGISTNYRSIKTIVDAGSCLIRNNHSCQLQKKTASNLSKEEPIKVLRSPHRMNYKRNYHKQIASDCLDRVEEFLNEGYAPKDILILSRLMQVHTHQMPRLHFIMENMLNGARLRGIKISRNPKTTRNVRLLTVHKAKGLEAKVVFVLNVIKDTYGFPCEIEDPLVLEPARENYPPQDQREEERRLFYVAMTRAKENLYIYTWEPAMSEFLEEIAEYTIEERLSY